MCEKSWKKSEKQKAKWEKCNKYDSYYHVWDNKKNTNMYIEIWKQGTCRQFTWNVDSYWPYETGLSSPDTKAIENASLCLVH